MSKLSPGRATIFLAALAVVSALLSNYAPWDPWEIFGLGPARERVPLLPGIYFGLVLCIGLFLWETKDAIKLVAAFIAVIIAWICAWKIAVEIYTVPERFHLDPAVFGSTSGDIPYLYAIAGFIAGLAGSLITVAGISFASRDSRTYGTWIRTILIGAVAGLLLQFQSTFDSILLLLLVWQPTIAASIAYGLVKPKSKMMT